MPPKKCPKWRVTHGDLFCVLVDKNSWPGQKNTTSQHSTCPSRLATWRVPRSKNQDWLARLAIPWRGKRHVSQAPERARACSLPCVVVVVVFFVCPFCFFVLLLRQRKQKFVCKAFLMFAFLICILRTPVRSPFFFSFFWWRIGAVFLFGALDSLLSSQLRKQLWRLPTIPSSWHWIRSMEGSEVVSIFSSFLGEFFDSTQVVLVVGSCESRRIRMHSWFYELGKKEEEEEEAQTIGWVPKTKLCSGGGGEGFRV